MLNQLNIDKLNIGLILFSSLLAFYIPFELFLFVYAFLDHYIILQRLIGYIKKAITLQAKMIIGL